MFICSHKKIIFLTKSNNFFSLLVLFLISTNSFSQENVVRKTIVLDSLSNWKNTNKVGFDLSEIAFVNWNAGGQSSVSGLLKGDFNRTYKRQNVLWFNELILRIIRYFN